MYHDAGCCSFVSRDTWLLNIWSFLTQFGVMCVEFITHLKSRFYTLLSLTTTLNAPKTVSRFFKHQAFFVRCNYVVRCVSHDVKLKSMMSKLLVYKPTCNTHSLGLKTRGDLLHLCHKTIILILKEISSWTIPPESSSPPSAIYSPTYITYTYFQI